MQEKQKKWILRIALYLIGIMVLALGITLNTKTNLGVSPIISMPYAVAQIFGYETGTAVFVAYLIFIVLQIVLLKGKFPPFQFLQVAASYLTSAFITIFDRIIPTPDQMGMRLLVLALAIILTGIGAAVTVDVNIIPNPADGLARVLGERCGKNMGFGKNLFVFLRHRHFPCDRLRRNRPPGRNRNRHCYSHGLHRKSYRGIQSFQQKRK